MMFLCICMPNRKEQCDRFFRKLRVIPTYIEPVDKTTLNIESMVKQGIVTEERRWRHRTPVSFATHQFEVACALSHLRAVAAIVDANVDCAFVFEDDNVIDDRCVQRFSMLVDWAIQNHTRYNVINISPCNSMHTMKRGMLPKTQGCTNALLYSRKGARAVQKSILPLSAPIDDWLHMFMEESYCLHPRICEQEDARSITSVKQIFVPGLRKLEYVVNFHSATMVVTALSICFLTLFYTL
jgi:GR25 family glycosyltransferase involved in LPS biosynthesis